MPHTTRNLLLLPGAGGSADFWRPLGERLPPQWAMRYLSWPGLGDQPADPGINSLEDLVTMVEGHLGDGPADLLAQSMGGVVALKLALSRPQAVRRIVLAVTSGGFNTAARATAIHDWRVAYQQTYPNAAAWIREDRTDLTAELPKVTCPVLLLFGEADPITPPSVGERLLGLLPNARLHIVAGGDHDLVVKHADEVAPLIMEHLR